MFEMKKKSLTVHENNDTWPNVTHSKSNTLAVVLTMQIVSSFLIKKFSNVYF